MSFKLFCCLCYILGILVILVKAKPQNFANSGIVADSSIKRSRAENNPTSSKVKRGTIIFPGEELPLKITEPRCANGGTFCTEVDNYPVTVVETVIKTDVKKYEGLFGDDLVLTLNITERFDPGEEEVLCKSEEKLIYPKLAKSNNDTWLYIINHNEYRQGIRIEMCASGTAGKKCSLTDSFPNSYTTECRQKYIYRHLVALNEKKETIKELFRFPSCCQCVIKHKQSYFNT